MLLYLVTVVFHQHKDKPSVHERQQVVEEERQADVDFLCLLDLLKQQQIKKYQSAMWVDFADHHSTFNEM